MFNRLNEIWILLLIILKAFGNMFISILWFAIALVVGTKVLEINLIPIVRIMPIYGLAILLFDIIKSKKEVK